MDRNIGSSAGVGILHRKDNTFVEAMVQMVLKAYLKGSAEDLAHSSKVVNMGEHKVGRCREEVALLSRNPKVLSRI
uniref:Uncharacterized protein n=1 Tax=Arundo donax TaxID=35708 RepID=A0A0A8ZKQ7_ARUDO